jgi:hypothetical protein
MSKSVKPWDMINPKSERVDSEEFANRISICKSCPNLVRLTTQCKLCGCFMNAKAKLTLATCPIKKW